MRRNAAQPNVRLCATRIGERKSWIEACGRRMIAVPCGRDFFLRIGPRGPKLAQMLATCPSARPYIIATIRPFAAYATTHRSIVRNSLSKFAPIFITFLSPAS